MFTLLSVAPPFAALLDFIYMQYRYLTINNVKAFYNVIFMQTKLKNID